MKKFLSYSEALKIVQTWEFKSKFQYQQWIKDNNIIDLPLNPNKVYKSEWINWSEFIGIKFLPYEQAKAWVNNLGLNNQKEWNKYVKQEDFPNNIRKSPTSYDEFEGFGKWLGTERIANQHKTYRSFEEARKWVKSLGLKTTKEWNGFTKDENFPIDIKKNPVNYAEFTSWGDWLGTGIISSHRVFRPFNEAKKWAQSLGLNNMKEWKEYTEHQDFPADIMKNPLNYSEFISWNNWLGL